MMCRMAHFSTPYGTEAFFALEAPHGLEFQKKLQMLFEQYDAAHRQVGLDANTEVYVRFYLSDIANQVKILNQMLRQRKRLSFVSIIGQPPASRSKVALEAYHVRAKKPIRKNVILKDVVLVSHGGYESLWVKSRPDSPAPISQQTQQLFGQLCKILEAQRASLEDNTLRTWIYVRDIDNNYQAMVDARREVFDTVGLTAGTRYTTSTGIEGVSETPWHLVMMDSLSVRGLKQKQIVYMDAPDCLCPAHEYGVTFERGIRVTYGDRTHYYLSGTASIDREGNTLHIGNVEKQADRTLMNIQTLLNRYGAKLDDLKLLIVYLRDISDTDLVEDFLKSNLSDGLPYIIVQGAVCRPSWLVEIEGVAVSSVADQLFVPFC